MECLIKGDLGTGMAILRDDVNVTIGFKAFGIATGRSPKSLMHMPSPKRNCQARSLFEIIAHLQEYEGIHLYRLPS